MNLAEEAGSGTQRLAQFQLLGDAAERYERWVVPFVTGPLVPALLDLANLLPASAYWISQPEQASSRDSLRAA